MAKGRAGPTTTLKVSTEELAGFEHPLAGFVYDRRSNFRARVPVKKGVLTLAMDESAAARSRVILVPDTDEFGDDDPPSPARLLALGGYEPVLRAPEGGLVDVLRLPGGILERWPFCRCLVRGRVIRSIDQRPVCGARVRICEVDRIPRWILELPDPDILKLRDDLIRAEIPPIPLPDPTPAPPGPLPPGPDPVPFDRPLLRFDPEREVSRKARTTTLPDGFRHHLVSTSSPNLLREALVDHWRLLPPFLCLFPIWWRFRCDSVAAVTTDANGRFEVRIPYECGGDHPDLYFTVEYDFGSGWETVHAPAMPCNTHWDYECGSEVTLRVPGTRVPACNDEPDLDGKQVWIISVGRTVGIGEILRASAGADEGKAEESFSPATSGSARFAFGGRLEPRTWFGRTALAADGIEHYLWSARPLGGGESDWVPLDRQVIRHYTMPDGTAPVEVMGPIASGTHAGRFHIRPKDPPSGGIEWLIADEREDLATAHLVTTAPPMPESPGSCGVADPNAGKVELKLELFDGSGNRVDWDAAGITLRVSTNEAPFGDDPVLTEVATEYHRIRDGGQTVAFRMVLHVDNSRSGGAIQPIAGAGLGLDPDCGVVTLSGSAPSLDVAFDAGRPGGLAHVAFVTRRGISAQVAEASASGMVGATLNGFLPGPGCSYQKTGLAPGTFLGACDQGAFAEVLRVRALTVNGYSRLSGLDAYDVAAFMLTEPCPGARGRGPGGGGSSGGG